MIKINCQKFIETDGKFYSEFYPTLIDALNVYTFQMFIVTTSQMNTQIEIMEKINEKKNRKIKILFKLFLGINFKYFN